MGRPVGSSPWGVSGTKWSLQECNGKGGHQKQLLKRRGVLTVSMGGEAYDRKGILRRVFCMHGNIYAGLRQGESVNNTGVKTRNRYTLRRGDFSASKKGKGRASRIRVCTKDKFLAGKGGIGDRTET